MNEREKTIARAAIRAYQRKGVQRTTMSEIAKEAQVTRQTVYNAFPNTDAVLCGAIRLYIGEQWQAITEGWETVDTLDQKLDILFLHFAIEPWEFLNSSPEAAQLENGYSEAGQLEIERSREGFRDQIAGLFTPYLDQLAAKGIAPLAVADFIGPAIEGIKNTNKTREDLVVALAVLKASLIALTT